ncbi:MAG: aldehyde ferredoxin oxidoreductase N-terminal domain-containing protein, partial [Dehalococcoidia bacterium]
MAEWYGWAGTILDVDLSTGRITKEPLSREMAVKYIGGRGLAARILYDEVGPETDPLGPDNIIVVTSGTLEGTRVPTAGRYDLTAKSPFTGIYGASNGGGFFGLELKRAGYDLIVIRGKSEKPVYLSIDNDDVEIRDAGHIWGQDTQVTEEMIRAELGHPKIRTLKIGPAGENECFSSCVIGDLSRAAGRLSIGAVWGSKKLKAVAVRGTKRVNVARPSQLKELCRKLRERAKEDPLYQLMRVYGTIGWVWEPLRDPEKMPNSSKETFDRDFFDKTAACANCDLHCSHRYSVKEGKYKGTEGEGPEAGALLAWPTIDNPAFVLTYNTLINKLGLTTSPAAAIERATVLYGEGIITKDDTGGIELRPGDEEVALELTRMIAYKEGFGKVLDRFHSPTIKMLRKGEGHTSDEKVLHGSRSGLRLSSAVTLAYSVATRGWDHLTGMPWATNRGLIPEMTDDILEKLGKDRYGDPQFFFGDTWAASPREARRVFDLEVICALADMTGTCKFRTDWVLYVAGLHLQDYADLLSAATGVDFTSEDLVKAT